MKVFLGGTCNESTWRERIIPMLKIDYFNPVVPDWNEESRKEELRQRKSCDLVLYTITPKMTGVYSIAELVDDSNKRPSSTVMLLLKEDEGLSFDEGQWRSLMAVYQLVRRNGALCYLLMKNAAWWLNNS